MYDNDYDDNSNNDCIVFIIGVNPEGLGVSRPLIFWAGDLRGLVGGRGRVVKHYYILSCTGSIFESGDFSSEIE